MDKSRTYAKRIELWKLEDRVEDIFEGIEYLYIEMEKGVDVNETAINWYIDRLERLCLDYEEQFNKDKSKEKD